MVPVSLTTAPMDQASRDRTIFFLPFFHWFCVVFSFYLIFFFLLLPFSIFHISFFVFLFPSFLFFIFIKKYFLNTIKESDKYKNIFWKFHEQFIKLHEYFLVYDFFAKSWIFLLVWNISRNMWHFLNYVNSFPKNAKTFKEWTLS